MAELTVPDQVTEVEYQLGTSLEVGPFTIPFSFMDFSDVKVVTNDGTTETTLELDIDYTIDGTNSGSGYSGGDVNLVTPGLSNLTLRIYRSTVIERTSNFPTNGPFDIDSLNEELNTIYTIAQELKRMRDTFLYIPESSLSTDPFDASSRAIDNLGELEDNGAAATVRRVKASGPNGINDDDLETGPLVAAQWNTVISQTNIEVQGDDATKTFDLLTEFFCLLQNRSATEAEVYIRYRHICDCYAEVAKQSNSAYRIKIPATSSIPLPFMDISRGLDYTNGNGTLSVFFDIYPLAGATNVWTQWNNLAVTTMYPS